MPSLPWSLWINTLYFILSRLLHVFRICNSHGGGTSFLFGTVTAAHNKDSIHDLRCHLDQTPSLKWMWDTVTELSGYWDFLVKKSPSIDGSFPGQQVLDNFNRWLRQGFNPDEKSVPSPAFGGNGWLDRVFAICWIEGPRMWRPTARVHYSALSRWSK